jgi:hypothetical protein
MKFHARSGWTAIPNTLLEDANLTSDGVRLISWLISHNGSFEVTRGVMGRTLGLGDHRLRKAIKEAKDARYLRTVNDRCKKTGQLKSRYEVSTDGRFTTSGKPTGIRTPNGTGDFTQIEAGFLGIFPTAPVDLKLYRFRLADAVAHFGLEYVIGEAERYAIDVASRTKGGGVAKPENWLWRLRWAEWDEVIEPNQVEQGLQGKGEDNKAA